MSDLFNNLVKIANQIKNNTESKCNINSVKIYVGGFNSWLHEHLVPSRPIWETAMFEASNLSIASFFLVMHGFYEESCSVLRGILEGFLVRLYWDEKDRRGDLKKWESNGRSTNEYWQWESGKSDKYPGYCKIRKLLEESNLIRRYNENYFLWNDIGTLKNKLNKFVHTRPESRHYDKATRSSLNITEFKEKHFNEWYKYLKSTYCIVSILSILQYPELFGRNSIIEFKKLEPKIYIRINNILSNLTFPPKTSPS